MKNGCVVGYGAIGPIHAKALKKMNCLYGVCDIDSEKIKHLDSVKKYSSYDDVLLDESVDVVHVCTPHYLHAEMAGSALAAGKDVVLEKPVGIDRSSVSKLMNYRGKHKICIMLQNRKNPSVSLMKKLIDGRRYGNLLSINAQLLWSRNEAYYAHDSWRGKWDTEGGGLLINQAVHIIDLVCWLGGGYSSLSGGISTRKLGDVIEVEDTADAVIELKSGIKAVLFATNCYPVNMPMKIEAVMENGILRYSDNMLTHITEDDVEVLSSDKRDFPGKAYWGSGHEDTIREFYYFLDGKSDSYIDISQASDAMNVIFDMYKK